MTIFAVIFGDTRILNVTGIGNILMCRYIDLLHIMANASIRPHLLTIVRNQRKVKSSSLLNHLHGGTLDVDVAGIGGVLLNHLHGGTPIYDRYHMGTSLLNHLHGGTLSFTSRLNVPPLLNHLHGGTQSATVRAGATNLLNHLHGGTRSNITAS